MSKPNNEPLAEDILRLADSLADDNATNDDELRRQLQESGIDPDALRARFHRSATRIAKREQVARRSVPLALHQAIEATRPADSPEDQAEDQSDTALRIADHWLDRLLSPLRFPSNLETTRAYRKNSQLAKSDQQELDQLESELKERVSETRPSPDLDLVTLVGEAFLRRFGLDSRERLAEIAEEIGIEVFLRHDAKLLTEHGKVGFVNSSIFPVVTIFCTTARLRPAHWI